MKGAAEPVVARNSRRDRLGLRCHFSLRYRGRSQHARGRLQGGLVLRLLGRLERLPFRCAVGFQPLEEAAKRSAVVESPINERFVSDVFRLENAGKKIDEALVWSSENNTIKLFSYRIIPDETVEREDVKTEILKRIEELKK